MSTPNGGLPPHWIPPHLVPLDTNFMSVESILELKLHLVVGGCRYGPIIDVPNRIYSKALPPDGGVWCLHCLRNWRKMQREAARKRA